MSEKPDPKPLAPGVQVIYRPDPGDPALRLVLVQRAPDARAVREEARRISLAILARRAFGNNSGGEA